MQGKAAGVAITAQSGAPGDAIAVRIRGLELLMIITLCILLMVFQQKLALMKFRQTILKASTF